MNFQDITNLLSNILTKSDFLKELQENNFFKQKIFAVYSVIFSILCNVKSENKNFETMKGIVKDFESGVSLIDHSIIGKFIENFSNITLDVSLLNNYISSFNLNHLNEDLIKSLNCIINNINLMSLYSS